MTKALDIVDVNIEITQRYLSYIMKENNDEINFFEEGHILNTNLKNLFNGMKLAYEKEKNLSVDIIFDYCKQSGFPINKEDIKTIKDSFDEYDITYLRRQIEQQHVRQVSNKQAIEDLLTNLTSANDIDIDKLKHFNDTIGRNLAKLESYGDISFGSNIRRYREDYKKRMAGKIKKRSMGDPLIDKFLPYAGEPGDMISIAMRTGTGKTTLALSLSNYLTNPFSCGSPVIYFSLDMGERTMINRILSTREGVTLPDLLMEDKPPEIERKIASAMRRYENDKHFILFHEPSVSLKEMDEFIYKAKSQFRENGVLDDDEYCVIIIDTLDAVDEFGGADAYGSLEATNGLHSLIRKHKCFGINLLQINESQIRGRKNITPEDVESLKARKENIWGSSAFSKRSRTILIGERLKHLKMELFPDHEDFEMWRDMEEDILTISGVKNNDGQLFSVDYIFDTNFYRILPMKKDK